MIIFGIQQQQQKKKWTLMLVPSIQLDKQWTSCEYINELLLHPTCYVFWQTKKVTIPVLKQVGTVVENLFNVLTEKSLHMQTISCYAVDKTDRK